MTVPLDLPDLTPDEAAHSAALVQRIRAVIEAEGGWIGFDRFMQLALYEPGLGYYSAGARKFGAAGDFITAPEVAPVFSRCLALQCAEVIRELGSQSRLLELGAGSGVMAAELLAELERQDALPAEYWILDLSADLRERQRETIAADVPHLLSRVQWLDSLPDEPFIGMILANEVIDALTFERFAIRNGDVNALGVSSDFGRLQLGEVRAASRLVAAVRKIEKDAAYPTPGWLRVRAAAPAWRSGSSRSRIRSSVVSCCSSTTACQDASITPSSARAARCSVISGTASTRTRSLASACRTSLPGSISRPSPKRRKVRVAKLAGYTTQAHFLIGCGLGDFVANVEGLDLVQRLNLSRQAMVLTLPGEMGERFKVIALSKDYDSPLRGFATRDLRHSL